VARYTGPTVKQSRREGFALTDKAQKYLDRRPYPPGEHGRGRIRQSEYLLQLREKQKTRRYYGLLEKQFRRYYEKANRRQARQLVNHGHFRVNGQKVDIPSYQVRADDVITVKQGSSAEPIIRAATELVASVAPWLQADYDALNGKVLKAPERSEIDTPVSEQLIVEYYSK
jgi:small subunit ribosomal protein S4